MKKQKDIVTQFKILGVFSALEAHLIANTPGGADAYHRQQIGHRRCRWLASASVVVVVLAVLGWLLANGKMKDVFGVAAIVNIGASFAYLIASGARYGDYRYTQRKLGEVKKLLTEARRLHLASSGESFWPSRESFAAPLEPTAKFLEQVGKEAANEVDGIERSRPNQLDRRAELKKFIANLMPIGSLFEEVIVRDMSGALKQACCRKWKSPFVWPGQKEGREIPVLA